jgi:hypothetical protein
MKIFLSWSGSLSLQVAEILRKYLPVMIQDLKPFLSKHDIGSGSRWSTALTQELGESSFGILCLTSENLNSAWLLFEAGALTKQVVDRACGLLIGPLKPVDIAGPLSQFQHRAFLKNEFEYLLKDINNKLDNPLGTGQLKLILDKWWPDIDRDYQEALLTIPGESERIPRDERDILEEILSRIRVIEKSQIVTEAINKHHLKIKGNQQNIAKFLMMLRETSFGGYATVFQQYSPDRAAVNIESDGAVDLMKLTEIARENEVELEWVEI